MAEEANRKKKDVGAVTDQVSPHGPLGLQTSTGLT